MNKVYIYYLKQDDEIVYVGQTINPGLRIQDHRYDKNKQFNNVKYMAVNEEEADYIECEEIRRHSPKYNRQGNNHKYVPYRRNVRAKYV